MKFSVNWLGEFVDLPASVDALADLLTFAGVEIEGIEQCGGNFDNVVVAQINSFAQHPNADRLSVCDVNDGTNPHRQIVCGAKNFKAGDKVPAALPGAELPNGLKIKVSKLRGVESQGMLCSPSELLLSQESDGLLILSPEAPVGAPLATIFKTDTILDVEITPNRGDLLSNHGLAREIAALTNKSLKPLSGPKDEPSEPSGGIEVKAPQECPFYSLRRIENVTVGPSPDWMRARLEAAGMRAINNIVDISNYVMLELGQPTHAFDADKIKGTIHVRLAREGETFLALDGRTYNLTPKDLVIADDERVVGIGGVMGGEDTGVTESTKNILLEAAYFLPGSIRRTARTLNLPSDASYRFERGVDPRGVLPASARATGLMGELAGARARNSIAIAGTPPAAPNDVTIRYARCNDLLGVTIAPKKVMQILEHFGLQKTYEMEVGSTWKIPSYRPDLRREVDLIEEVVRAYGLDKIPTSDRSHFTPQSEADRARDFETELRQRLVALGLFEARTSALIPRHAAAQEGAVELKNPLSEDHVALRPSIVRGLLDVLGRNVNMGATSVRLFELGNIFLPPDATEKRAVGLVISGASTGQLHWRQSGKRQLDFFDLKGAIDALRIPNLSFRRTENSGLALAAEILSADQVIGLAGQLRSERAAQVGANGPVFVAQIVLDAIAAAARNRQRFQEMDKFPSVTRDIAMIVPENIAQGDLVAAIRTAEEPLLSDIRLFDLFAGSDGGNIAPGRKSLAYSLTYRDRNRTLTNDEVTVIHDRIRERLKRELGAELRE